RASRERQGVVSEISSFPHSSYYAVNGTRCSSVRGNERFCQSSLRRFSMRTRFTYGCATLAMVVLAVAGLVAQQRGGGGAGGGAPQGPPMMITSPVLTDMGNFPAKYSCAGTPANVSPPLAWSNAPAGTQSFVILIHDLEP